MHECNPCQEGFLGHLALGGVGRSGDPLNVGDIRPAFWIFARRQNVIDRSVPPQLQKFSGVRAAKVLFGKFLMQFVPSALRTKMAPCKLLKEASFAHGESSMLDGAESRLSAVHTNPLSKKVLEFTRRFHLIFRCSGTMHSASAMVRKRWLRAVQADAGLGFSNHHPTRSLLVELFAAGASRFVGHCRLTARQAKPKLTAFFPQCVIGWHSNPSFRSSSAIVGFPLMPVMTFLD